MMLFPMSIASKSHRLLLLDFAIFSKAFKIRTVRLQVTFLTTGEAKIFRLPALKTTVVLTLIMGARAE